MDRLAAARDRLDRASAELSSPAIDFPCVQCRHFALVCNHPAVAEIRANPVTGAVGLEPTMSAAEARGENGPCGPEGALFDSRSMPAAALVTLLSTEGGRWVVIVGLLIVGLYLLG